MNEIKQIEATLDKMNAEMAEVRKQYQEKAQSIFKEMFKTFFDANPEVHVIGWRQYTPYFNDGDACVFRSNADYAFASNATDYENVSYGEYEGDVEGVWVMDVDYGNTEEDLIPDSVNKSFSAFLGLLGKIDDEVYLDMFGDHCTVYATREGFDVTEYEHD